MNKYRELRLPIFFVQEDDMSNIRIDGLDIKYKFLPAGSVNSSTGVPYYGVSATAEKRPFASIIIHHTAGDSISGAYNTAFNDLRGPSGDRFYAGYHFLVGKDGAIWQTAPEEVRTNHSRAERLATGVDAQRRSPFNNRAAIGVGFVGSGFYNPQGIQRENGLKLVACLMKKYRISKNMIKAHYDTDQKDNDEGVWIYDAIRSGELDKYIEECGGSSGSSSGAAAFGGAIFLVGIILGGIYGWRRFIKPRLERAKAEKLLRDRQNRVTITKFRAANKARIEAAKYNPVLADQLQKELYVLLK
jgi:hypothetical protein